METKKIVLKRLSKVLSENEMKGVTGGYGGYHACKAMCSNGSKHPVFCDSVLDCEYWRYFFCKNGVWMHDCY